MDEQLLLQESEMNKSLMTLTAVVGGLASSAASAAVQFSSVATDVGAGLVQHVVTLSTLGAGAKPIAALDLEFTGSVSQQGAPLITTFQDNNAVIPALGGVVNRDTQWLFNSATQLTAANGTRVNGHGNNSESAAYLSGIFGFVPVAGGGPGNIPVGAAGRGIAQIVLPAGQSATFAGQVSFDDGSFVNVTGVIPVPEPAALGFLTITLAGLTLGGRRRRA
jgi:hypothetical protein